MSNLKISQLPDFTGSTAGSWLIANNASETTTFKIERENFLSGYAPTSDLTALSSSIAVTDLGQNNRINSIEGVTGSFATTGSNTFIGTETISGSVVIQGSGNTALNVNGGNSLFSGSIIINGSSPSGTKYLFFNNASGSAGAQINYATTGNGILGINAGISGSISIGTTQAGNNTLFGNTRITGSQHTIVGNTTLTGSLGIRGNVQGTGSINFTGSLRISGSGGDTVNVIETSRVGGVNFIVGGGNWISSYGGSGLYTEGNIIDAYNGGYNTISGSANFLKGPTTISGALTVSGSAHRIVGNTTLTGSLTASGSLSVTGVNNFIVATGSLGNNNNLTVYNGNNTISSVSGGFVTLNAFDGNGGIILNAYNSPSGIDMSGSLRVIGNTTITGSLNVTSGATISGSIIQTGSVQGNIVPLTITSNTASLNLNNGNFFTLQLVSGSATHLNPSNIKPGQTVSVFVNTIGSATMTFPSSIKQIIGSSYVPTTGTGIDILTLISKDTSSLYLVNAKNFS